MMPGRGPFDDPFFSQDPFARMNTMMGSMFNDPFFQGGPFGPSMMIGDGIHSRPDHRQNRHRSSQAGHPDEGVTIEEVDEEQQQQPRYARRAHHQPTVEEPDDHHQTQRRTHTNVNRQHSNQQHHTGRGMPDMFGGMPGFNMSSSSMGGGGGTSFSYSSSSYSSGGPGGVRYSSTTTHRQGPGGVAETNHQTYDGRTGEETIKVSRALGDKARTITRTRDAHGRERAVDQLRNIDQAQAARFDEEWATHAHRTLPQSRRGRGASPAVPNRSAPPNNQYLLGQTAPRYA